MRRVLVVEDEPTIRELVADALREAGFYTETAANGLLGFDRMRANPPHVLVLDLMMPVLDAVGLVKLMRLDRGLQRTPIVVMTADFDAWALADELGAAAYITKPFQLDELVETVARLAGEPSARQLVATAPAPR